MNFLLTLTNRGIWEVTLAGVRVWRHDPRGSLYRPTQDLTEQEVWELFAGSLAYALEESHDAPRGEDY